MRASLIVRILLVLVALTTLISLCERDLFVGDETKYAQVIRGMRAEGSLLVPMIDGRPYSHKPPLHFWAIYLLASFFGHHSIWPFVLPSLLGYAVLLVVVWRLARELFDTATADVAAFVLATLYLIWGLAQTARMDLSFAIFITLAAHSIWRFLESRLFRNITFAGLFTGIAILIKGPMALVIVLVLFIVAGIRRGGLPRGNYLPAIALAALIPLSWLVPAVMVGGEAYAEDLLIRQNIGRALGSWVHAGPPWFYVVHFPATFFPWFLTMILAIVAVSRRPVEAIVWMRARFLVIWFLAVLIPFSLISGKLDVYMVPAAAPLAILAGWFIVHEPGDRLARIAIRANMALVASIGFLALAIPIAAGRFRGDEPEWALLDLPKVRGLFLTTALVAAAGLVAAMFATDRRLLRTSIILGTVALAPLVHVTAFLMPVANELASSRPLIRALLQQPYSGRQIALYWSPHLWSRDLPAGLHDVRYIGERGLEEALGDPPQLVATQERHAAKLGPRLESEYERIDRFRMRGRWFELHRRR